MRAILLSVVDRFGRRVVITVAAMTAVILGLSTAVVSTLTGSSGDYLITAQFVATPGLYAHNSVTVLGVPTGHVVSVKPQGVYVNVVMAVPRSVNIPANAQAVLMAPNPVSDRFVELTPPYSTGAVMAHGATIPLERTVVPLELDQVYASVDDLSKLLGPGGANQSGDLSAALHAFAELANGNGADVHAAITSIAAALPALTQHPDDLSKLINGLDTLTRTLAGRDATINALYSDLGTATSQLADERQVISSAVANLQRGLQQVATFIRANQANITGSVHNLSVTVDAVMREQTALVQAFDTAPLGFQNFNKSIDLNAACISATGTPHDCSALWGRLDFTKDAASLLKLYCGDTIMASVLPILQWNAHLGQATARETACGAELGLLQNRVGPSGAPNTPDLDLSHYLGTR